MPVPTFGGLPPYPTFEDLVNKVETLTHELRNLLLNLDTLNIAELNAEVIIAGTIDATKISVDKLSAISADLGEISAGIVRGVEMYGSYISTNETGYPRTEMSNSGNYFRVSLSPDQYINVNYTSADGEPSLEFVNGPSKMTIGYDANGFAVMQSQDYIMLSSLLSANSGIGIIGKTDFIDWSNIKNLASNRTLQQEIDDLKQDILNLQSGKADKGVNTGTAGSHNHGIAPGTVLLTDSGSVTWSGAGSHSHNQE